MLVNKSGRKLVIGRLNVKNGEAFPGIPFTADERKGIEKFVKKGYIVEEKEVVEAKPEPVAAPVAEPIAEPVVNTVVEEVKPEPVVETVENPVEQPIEQPAEQPKAEPVYKSSRRRRKLAEASVTEDVVSNND